jgi:hypothetical protein
MDLAALRRWWPLAAVLGLLSLAALAATRSTPQLERIRPRADTGAAPTPEYPAGGAPPTALPDRAPEVTGGLPEWVVPAVLVLLGVAGAVLIAGLIWAIVRDQLRRRNRRVGPATPHLRPEGRTADDLVAALDAGLLDLSDTDRDPRRAVIACWVRLEQAAADAGTPRHPGDTPTDLVGRLLAEQQVDAGVLAALAEVYREARYATHTVDDQMRTHARTALQRLRADLAAPAAARGPAGRPEAVR